MKLARFLVVHLLGTLQRYFLAPLLHYHLSDGIDAASPLGGVGVGLGHVDAEQRHRPLPGNGVAGHGVVEHAVNIEEHGFGLEPLKAVLL